MYSHFRGQTLRRLCWLGLTCLGCNIVFGIWFYHDVHRDDTRQTAVDNLQQVHRPDLACDGALHIPAVALLFLIKNSFPLEAVWQQWFAAAHCAVPVDVLARYAACGAAQAGGVAQLLQGVVRACGNDSADAVSRNSLFSVYVHSSPNHKPCVGFPGSLLDGRELPRRLATEWGQHSLVQAMRALLREALQAPRNQKFVFLSEADAPLYPPAATYLQLMREPASRVHTCPLGPRVARLNPGRYYKHDFAAKRWHPGMATSNFSRSHWRKSPQWVALGRQHAQAVVDDVHVEALFSRYCHFGWDEGLRREQECVSDEHYIPSLLTSLGMANQTNSHALAFNVWRWRYGHPMQFSARPRRNPATPPVSSELLALMRYGWKGCNPDHSLAQASELVKPATLVTADLLAATAQRHASLMSYNALPLAHCPLFARKFAAEAADALAEASAPCYALSACEAVYRPALLQLNVLERLDFWVINALRGACVG